MAVQPSKRDNVTVTSQSSEQASTGEINVIGMTVEQASERVDKFLDECGAGESNARAHYSRTRNGSAADGLGGIPADASIRGSGGV